VALSARRVAMVTALVSWLLAPPARAEPENNEPSPDSLAFAAERPTGMAEFGFGWLTLPGAHVCARGVTLRCSLGDSSLSLEAWQLFRLVRRFAWGAGLTLGLTPTATPDTNVAGTAISREHSRRYLTVEGTLRYYPYIGNSFEAWVGLTSGVAVVSDAFSVNAVPPDDRDLVGPKGVTIRTEGFTLGGAVGGAYELLPNWLLGANLRYGSWFLPEKPARDPLGDQASLRGQNSMFVIALNMAYRVPF
jgi:hypothetical protein